MPSAESVQDWPQDQPHKHVVALAEETNMSSGGNITPQRISSWDLNPGSSCLFCGRHVTLPLSAVLNLSYTFVHLSILNRLFNKMCHQPDFSHLSALCRRGTARSHQHLYEVSSQDLGLTESDSQSGKHQETSWRHCTKTSRQRKLTWLISWDPLYINH